MLGASFRFPIDYWKIAEIRNKVDQFILFQAICLKMHTTARDGRIPGGTDLVEVPRVLRDEFHLAEAVLVDVLKLGSLLISDDLKMSVEYESPTFNHTVASENSTKATDCSSSCNLSTKF